MKPDFNFTPTCIGSLPYTNAAEACKKILREFSEIPFWPQLPKRSFLENMYVQYSEGLPNVIINEKDKTVSLRTSPDLAGGIERAYEKFLSDDLDYFAISEKYAEGLYEFLKQFKNNPPKNLKFVKGQVTGPVSFGLAVLDENKQSIFYNRELQEVLTKVLCMKAKWQIKKLRQLHDKVIIFIDEPYMVSIGSSYVNIKAEDAVKRINEVIEEIHNGGALAGIHCCGNTDWGLLLGTELDIISFDAYDYVKSISLYPDALKKFITSGKCIAWGIVPTSDEKGEKADLLLDRLGQGFETLAKKGIKKEDFLNASLVTPSCGCGTLTEARTGEVLELTLQVAARLREKK